MILFLKIFEVLWFIACIICIGAGVFHAIQAGSFEQKVYLPVVVGIMCALVAFNLRRQRKFMEQHSSKKQL